MEYGKEWKTGVALGAVIGAVSGWFFATLPGWVDAWGREHWWNIATAFGTVGATLFALVSAISYRFLNRREARIRGQISLADDLTAVQLWRQKLEELAQDIDGALSLNPPMAKKALEKLSLEMSDIGSLDLHAYSPEAFLSALKCRRGVRLALDCLSANPANTDRAQVLCGFACSFCVKLEGVAVIAHHKVFVENSPTNLGSSKR